MAQQHPSEQLTNKQQAPNDWIGRAPLFLFPALAGGLFGYDIGVSSGVIVSLTSATSGWGIDLNALETGWVVSSSLLGASLPALISLVLPRSIDSLGRREELMCAAALYLSGATLSSQADSLNLLVCGKILYGLGIGLAMRASPAYIAETSPKEMRGFLISMKEAIIVLGIVCGYAVSGYFSGPAGWRSDLLASVPVAGLVLAGMALLPESPRFLYLRGREAEGQDAIKRCFPNLTEKELQEEAESIKSTVVSDTKEGLGGRDVSALSKLFEYRRPLLIGSSLMLFQQITGQPSVLYYANKLFVDSGLSFNEAGQISLGVALFKFATTFIAASTVDKVGRRPLLLTGVSGMVGALIILGVDPSPKISLAALLLFVGSYQISFGPISWLIVGELFPLQVRSLAISFATLVNFSSNFGVSLVLPQLQERLGIHNLYFSFAAIGLISLISIYFTVPETKGRSLEEIQSEVMRPMM